MKVIYVVTKYYRFELNLLLVAKLDMLIAPVALVGKGRESGKQKKEKTEERTKKRNFLLVVSYPMSI